MPQFTIETTYHLPVFQHSTYLAETPEVACRFAIARGEVILEGPRDPVEPGDAKDLP